MRFSFPTALGVGLVLLISACGGGDEPGNESEGQPASTPSQTQGAAGSDAPTPPTTGNEGSSAAGDVEACSLLTPEEIGEAYGTEIGPGESQRPTNQDASACMWPGLYLEVLTEGGPDWYETVNFGQNRQPVEGLGDEASMSSPGVLDVVEGDSYISLQVISGPFLQIDRAAAAETLAEIVLSRLE